MEGVPPSFMDDDVNQWDLQAPEDNFNMSELPSSINQSSMLCNYQAGQKTLVDNDVIYDSIQQTMTTMGHLDGTSSSWMNQNGPNWQQTPSSEQQWGNELPMSNQVPGMLPQPPMNQCSRQFPYQSNQVPIMHNQYDPQCSTMLPEPSQTLRQEEEAAAPIQTTMGHLDGTSSSRINPNGPNWPQTLSSEQQWANELPMSNQVPGILPQPPMNQYSGQFPYQFNQVPITPNLYDPQCSTMLPEPSQTLRQEEEAAAPIQVSKITSSKSLHKEPPIKMNRPRHPLWEHVVQVDGGILQCKYCPHKFGKDTSITRIKSHWSGVKGKGAIPCVGNVPKAIIEAALGRNGSSHIPPGEDVEGQSRDTIHAESAIVLEENSEIRGDPLPTSSTGEMMAHQQEHLSLEDPLPPSIIVEDEEPRGDPSQPTNVSSRIPPGEDVAGPFADQSLEAIQFGENRGDPFPTSSTMLVGRAFEANARQIRSWIIDDEVSTIGIYGMAGVGKTELLKHIHNDLLQSQDSTHRLYWVNVSEKFSVENFSIERLQNLIAKRIGLDLSSEDDDLFRSVKLFKELRDANRRWILFLDDLWENFELPAVGIPEKITGCKLIVSTQSENVCRRVAGPSIIKVDTLSHEDAMSLFMMNLGPVIELSPAKKKFANCIVTKCGGMPLGIITVARFMKKLRYDRQWRDALKDLEQSSVGYSDMEMVFPLLKLSYTRLKKFCQQQAFLRCALFPKAFMIPKDDLIAYLIDEGVIKSQESREAEFRRGHDLLERLEDVCLLESIDDGSAVKMHDLIRDMAIKIYDKEHGPVIIKAGENLKNLLDAGNWRGSLVTASLIENQIKEIPSRHSPRCPKLSTLLLHYNRELELIDDTFFNQLLGLKILNLSHTVIVKLPDSVSNLVELTTLLLIDCKKLVHVPSLENLGKMRRLDLYRTALENIPQGLECLSELRYLRMSSCGQKKFPGWVLRKLSHLQVFILGCGKYAPMTVKGEEIGCLEKLEDLECHFKGHSDLVAFFKYWDQTDSLQTCKVRVGQFEENDGYNVKTCYRDKTVGFDDLRNKYGDFQVTFSNENQELIIRECSSMESFVSSSRFRSSPLLMPSNNGKFSCLKEFYCVGCKSMKKLFPLVLLKNLEVIEVSDCEKMVEIIERKSDDEGLIDEESSRSSRDDEGLIDEESSRSSRNTDIELPKLKKLKLIKLPELKSIFSAKLICDSLEVIHIKNCEKLKRITIFLPFLESNERKIEIIIHPKEWWVSALEWGHPNAKDALDRIVKFQETTGINEIRPMEKKDQPLIS